MAFTSYTFFGKDSLLTVDLGKALTYMSYNFIIYEARDANDEDGTGGSMCLLFDH